MNIKYIGMDVHKETISIAVMTCDLGRREQSFRFTQPPQRGDRCSDRTMVGNSATRLACEFQRTKGAVMSANMKRQGPKSIQGPLLRGLAGRSATGQNDQAAAEEMWLRELGAGCRKNIPAVPAGRSVFHLTSPLIGLLAQVDCCSGGDAHHWVPPM
jgi:hypothetical protein